MSKRKAKEIKRLSDLTPDARNANKGTERGTGLLESSLRTYGAGRSVLADRNGKLIAGNKTVEGAASIGIEDILVVPTDGKKLVVVQRTDLDLDTDKAARELAIADNRVGEVSLEWDAAELEATARDFDIDLESLGFSEKEMAGLLKADPAEVTEDEIPANVPARCKAGDLWQLGEHCLLCGDSTKGEDVGRLLGGAVPFIMVTDPPYGVEYDPTWREKYDDFALHSRGTVANDDRCGWEAAYTLFPGDVAYTWHAGVFAGQIATDLAAAKFEIRAQIIWAKQHFVFGRGSYHWQHEPCWYAVRKGKKSKWGGDRTQSTLWEIANKNPMGGKQDDENTQHGTQKPVECMARPIRNHGGKGDDVYDPFLGSGTTLIAAEQLGRRCYGMEISPAYCDVILQRWENWTGKKAKLVA